MPALSAAEIPASPAASFLAASSGILPAAMPPAARQLSNPGHVGLEGERLPTHTCDGAPDDSSAMYPTTKTPYAGQPKRPAAARSTVSSAGAKNGGRIVNCSLPPLQHRHGSLGAEGVEDPRHRNRALSHAGARLGPQRHGLVAHREHLWVSPQCIRRLPQ
jgi:hypothetical protein